MVAHPLPNAIKKIEQHLARSRKNVEELASCNLSRVLGVYDQLGNALKVVYIAGEGWIEQDVHNIIEGVNFAAKKHQSQLRKDMAQTSYLVHLLSVAHHLVSVGHVRIPEIIIASLLHDTLEDTETTYQEIISLFGEKVADYVQEVTDNKSLPKVERKRLQIVTAPHKSAGAAQIKLADKWDNLNDLLQFPPPEWTHERIISYFAWAKQVVEALPWVNANLVHSVEKVLEEYQNVI
jgi:guanosine-3',5'-bis(diphosphate) 3'-pyrophosphohydrolase